MTEQEREALPPLPEPKGEFFVLGRDQAWNERTGQYTADQMHAYARAALAATPAPTPAQAQQDANTALRAALTRVLSAYQAAAEEADKAVDELAAAKGGGNG
jgi:ABC-type microcin C transport system duplicated ATPase subunit YejF